MNLHYINPQPRPSGQLIGLGALAVAGLLALWLAAFAAFSNIAAWPQAAAASTLIEAGLIIEALAWMRWRSYFALTGLIASLVVSGTYNYIQATQAAPEFTWVPLFALALGPLVALATVALALGDALARHQLSIDDWEAERAVWLAGKQTEFDAESTRQRERREQIEDEDRLYRRKQNELTQKRAEKRERLANEANDAESNEQPAKVPLEVPQSPLLSAERSLDKDEHLNTIRKQANGVPFKPADIQTWTGNQKTAAYGLLKYGQAIGEIKRTGRGRYQMTNGSQEAAS